VNDREAPESVNAPLDALDDERDREELRGRYEMFLQELRVILPGVTVLLAFLFTVPFSQRFGELDRFERRGFGLALISATLSVIFLVSPSVFHRIADRTARQARLRWGLRMSAVGLVSLAVALVTAMWTVCRLIYGSTVAWFVSGGLAAALVGVWIALPLAVVGRGDD